MTFRTTVPIAAVLLLGCASTSPKATFQDMASLIEARTGHRIVWNQGGADDEAVARTIHDLASRELTVESAIQIALLNNKVLQATYEDLSVAQADLVQAGLLRNPVFGAGIAFPVAGLAQTGVSLSVSQDFLSVFLLAARKKVAEADLRATTLRVGNAVLHLNYEVELAFYDLAARQQISAMRRTILEAGDAGLDLAQRQREAGNISDLDLANEQSLYEQVRTDLVRSDAEVIAAREALTRLLGLWGPDATYRIAEKLPELPEEEVGLEHLESFAVGRRLDLGAAHEEAEALSQALAMARNYRWLGATSVAGNYEHAPEGFAVAGPSVSVEVPIFDQKQGIIARLEGRLRASLAREAALAVDVRSEVRAARSQVVATRAVVERYAKVVVPLRQRVVALTQEHYNGMLLGPYQLLQAKENEVTSYREFIEALRDYWAARANLERATGGTVPLVAPHAATTPSKPGATP
jgi:cobalt-zinc-cadmium efflux system outer membrane protein